MVREMPKGSYSSVITYLSRVSLPSKLGWHWGVAIIRLVEGAGLIILGPVFVLEWDLLVIADRWFLVVIFLRVTHAANVVLPALIGIVD